MPLKTSTVLRYATLVGNETANKNGKTGQSTAKKYYWRMYLITSKSIFNYCRVTCYFYPVTKQQHATYVLNSH